MAFRKRWQGVPKWLRIVIYTVLGIVGLAAMGLVFGYGIQLLWNWLMPRLFHAGEITFWEAIGIFVLARILFGGIGGSSDSKKSKERKEHKAHPEGKEETKEEPEGMEYYDVWWEREGKRAFEEFAKKKQDG